MLPCKLENQNQSHLNTVYGIFCLHYSTGLISTNITAGLSLLGYNSNIKGWETKTLAD